MRIVADRFVRSNHEWIDLGTGLRVRVRSVTLDSAAEQFEWDMRCATIARLRHPLLNRLIDYGSIGTTRFFEAYSCQAPLRFSTGVTTRLVAHATRFLSTQGIALNKSDFDILVRPIEAGRWRYARPIGVILQHRSVYDVVVEALAAESPPGPCVIMIEGSPGSGVRTLRMMAARIARLHGYVPVDATMVTVFPWLADEVTTRHVCVLANAASLNDASLRSLLVRIGVHGARRHVLLVFGGPASASMPKRVALERMGVAAMTGMVFIDREHGPGIDDVFAAAKLADGRPGSCIDRLGAGSYEPVGPRRYAVHETPQSYGETTVIAPVHTNAEREHRVAAVLRRSLDRGDALVRRGRHVSAERLLSRAIRVFAGRKAMEAVAEASVRLGFLELERGHMARASSALEAARQASPIAAPRAAVGLGLTWIEEGRFAEAEAVLRTAVITADNPTRLRAACALGECLYWMGRFDEAMLVLDTAPTVAGSPDLANLVSRRASIQLAEGQLTLAVRTARSAVEMATALESLPALAASYQTLATALASAGDEPSAAQNIRTGLVHAARAHLPLAAARLRLTLAEIQSKTHPTRARRVPRRILARKYPPLVCALARAVLGRLESGRADSSLAAFIASSGAVLLDRPLIASLANPVADLEAFLDLGHTASDDCSAIERIVASLQAKLRATSVVVVAVAPDRRVLSVAGRPWHGEPQVAWSAAGAGATMPVDSTFEPAEAAEPIRYCG